MRINEAVRLDIRNSVLCWLATIDDQDTPNVSPKEIFASYGDNRIAIADIASSGSVENVRRRSRVCVSFVDVFRQRGFKIIGRAEIVHLQDPSFAEIGAELLRMAGADFPIRNIICVETEKIFRIWAPSYKLFPNRSEEERMRSAYDIYEVQPKNLVDTNADRVISRVHRKSSNAILSYSFYPKQLFHAVLFGYTPGEPAGASTQGGKR